MNKKKVLQKNKFAACMPIISLERESLFSDMDEGVMAGCDFLEWRRDHFMKGEILSPTDEEDFLKKIKKRIKNQGFIYTYRSHQEGGAWETSDLVRIEAIKAAVASGAVDYVDVELKSNPEFLIQVKDALKSSNTQLILSHHNFNNTPSAKEIEDIFDEMEALGGDVLKLAVMPNSEEELRRLIRIGLNYDNKGSESPVIVIAMGSLGGITRVVPELSGGSLTYVAGRGKTAPGQLSLEEIQSLRKRMGLL